jgi:hypothetical protein
MSCKDEKERLIRSDFTANLPLLGSKDRFPAVCSAIVNVAGGSKWLKQLANGRVPIGLVKHGKDTRL